MEFIETSSNWIELNGIFQTQREATVDEFSRGQNCFLISTDLCARGIDIRDITHVFNYDMAHEVDTWVHRIGRTGRAGAKGSSITLLNVKEKRVAIDLVDVLQKCDQKLGPDLKWLERMAKMGRAERDAKERLGKR